MVLSLMACAMLAAGVSRLVAGSMYNELAALLPLPGAAASEPAAEQRQHRGDEPGPAEQGQDGAPRQG
jgi:hypothetical protein